MPETMTEPLTKEQIKRQQVIVVAVVIGIVLLILWGIGSHQSSTSTPVGKSIDQEVRDRADAELRDRPRQECIKRCMDVTPLGELAFDRCKRECDSRYPR